MNARYIRVSTITQKIERQLVKEYSDEILYIDKISGAVPFAKRPQGKKLLKEILEKNITQINVSSIDRLGRNTLDILQTIKMLHNNTVCLRVDNLGLESLIKGKENPTFKLIASVLANVSEMERETMLERQKEGIAIAKAKGVYKGREKDSIESDDKFLSKYPAVVSYLRRKKQSSISDIAKLCNCSKNTVLKVKTKLADKKG